MANFRNDFPALRNNQCYLDNAATTHKPQVVIDAITEVYRNSYAPVYRGLYDQAERMTERYEGVRVAIADWLGGAKPHEIVLTFGATDGMNAFITSWARHAINKGDEIVFTELDHHMVVASCRALAQERSAVVRVIPVHDKSCRLSHEKLGEIITSRTRMVVLPISSNIRGPLLEEEINSVLYAARSVGAIVVCDASQVPAHQSLSSVYNRWKPDVMIWSGHKSFGPSGVGVLYISEALHNQLVPYHYGGGMLESVSDSGIVPRSMPRLLEAGTRPIEAVIGLGVAVDYIKNLDYEEIKRHEARLVSATIMGISDIPGISILGDRDVLQQQGHMVTFSIDGIHSHDIATYLAEQGVSVRAGDHCCKPLHDKLGLTLGSVRISFACYNTLEDVHKVVTAIRSAARILC